MFLAGDGVPDEQRQRDEEGDDRHDGKEETDAEERVGRLHRRVRIEAVELQRPAHDERTNTTGDLAQQGVGAKIDALVAFTGSCLVHLDHVRDHAPREDVLRGETQPGDECHHIDQGGGVIGQEERADDGHAGNSKPEGISGTFIEFLRNQLPGDEEEPDRAQHHQHDQEELVPHVEVDKLQNRSAAR